MTGQYAQHILKNAKQDTLDYAERYSITDEEWLEISFLWRVSKEIHFYYAKMNTTYMLGQTNWDYYITEKIMDFYEKRYYEKQEELEQERNRYLWQTIQ